jgi:hypothetical protein
VWWIELDDVETVRGTIGTHDLRAGTVKVGLGVKAVGGGSHRTLPVDEKPTLPMHLGNEDVDVDVMGIHRPCAVGHIGDDLQRHSATRRPRHRNAVHGHRHDLAGIAREQHRNPEGGKRALADGRHGGGLGGRVVADQKQHPPAWVGAVHVGVPQCVGRPIQARPLAVPDADDAVVSRRAHGQIGLAAPHRCGGQFFVEARDEGDVMSLKHIGHAGEHPVDAAQWAALVSGHEGRDAQASTGVTLVLFDERACDCLHTGDHDGAGSRAEAITQFVRQTVRPTDIEICHRGSPPRRWMGCLLPIGNQRYTD